MFEKLKKMKSLNIGITKNSRKYNITHNGDLDELCHVPYDSAKIAYLLKPITAIKEKESTYNETDKHEEITYEKGKMIIISSPIRRSMYSENKFHEKLMTFQEVHNRDFSFCYPSIKDKYTWYHANEDALKRYAIACTSKFQLTIDSLTDSVTIEHKKLVSHLYGHDSEAFEIMCRIIDIFENFEPLIVNQFAPGIIDTLKNLLVIFDTDAGYISKRDIMQELRLYIKDVHETIISFGEEIETFPTPYELIEEKKIEKEQEKKAEEEKIARERKADQEKQNDFIEKLRARRELLKDFNEPMENVPLKLAKKNEEMFNDFLKENA